jgi:hypothetical protein
MEFDEMAKRASPAKILSAPAVDSFTLQVDKVPALHHIAFAGPYATGNALGMFPDLAEAASFLVYLRSDCRLLCLRWLAAANL